MHSFQSFLLLAIAAVGAHAEFWLAKDSLSTVIPGPVDPSNGNYEWIFAPDLNDCGTATQQSVYVQHSDVSGDKHGVRVEWVDPNALFDELLPSVVEWNTWGGTHASKYTNMKRSLESALFDWLRIVAWYADRNGGVADLDGNELGHCSVDKTVNNDCDLDAGSVNYQSLLHCDFDLPR
ncbi:hypothetical protein NM208_g4232 [Fusarium decemcellulare]|uniref:Uncharacterized protein n=1 Tax=Fusarium decemcellulare TaxID=57161 RepID=A0ACC1SLM7_9HYPO|nr:hypothetical protein NM208_g4232 [Fusarium decemcellulare]